MDVVNTTTQPHKSTDRPWRRWFGIAALMAAAASVIWVTNAALTDRYSASTRAEAEVRLALFSGGMLSELRRNSIVPQLLARDSMLISALQSEDYGSSSRRLIEFRDEIGAANLILLDSNGRVVASTDRIELGANQKSQPFVVEALRSGSTVFTTVTNEVGLPRFFYSRKIEQAKEVLGVIVVEVDLQRFERSWAGITEAVIVTDSSGVILLTTQTSWRGHTEEEILAQQTDRNVIERVLLGQTGGQNNDANVILNGQRFMRNGSRIPFQGWHIVAYTSYDFVRGRVNAVLAFEVMGFAIAIAALFFFLSLRAERRSEELRQESEELRQLNIMLQHEIAERQKAEKNLEVAEQSLAQSSKLAALGEMSAAVSHELNQPLAAMKTYLAGARLLLRRRRPEEAIASFQRIDDLIERMATITRQLKSYAGKGNERPAKIDLRDAVTNSIEMMTPQLRQQSIRITRTQPASEVWVLADQIRIEQVIVNLLRNAVDAIKDASTPEIDVILSLGSTATLTVRDNGTGIAEIESLFEPFYSTKVPGEGLGLGLAISSSIAADLGGRLTARNRPDGGAVFELKLPNYGQDNIAAE